jgi:hypothetical protein
MKAHRTDGLSLTFGLLFAAFVVWWLVLGRVDVKLPALGWLVAGALILFGLLGLLGALRANRAAHEQPVSAAPVSGAPVTGPPASGSPVSGSPLGDSPVSGPPVSGSPVSGSGASLADEPTVVQPRVEDEEPPADR